MKINLRRIISSPKFKKAVITVGGVFTVATFFVIFKPEPFLRFGYPGVFVFNLVGPGTFLIPILARYMNVYILALVSASGMAINDTVSWYVGKSGDVILPRSKRVIRAEKTLHKYGPFGLLFFAFIPIPYDFIGLIAGYLEFPFWRFWIPTFIARFVRFVLIGGGVLTVFGAV